MMMATDIYFAGSIRGGRQDAELYGRIIKLLAPHGTVLTEHVANIKLSDKGEEHDKENLDDEAEIHDRNIKLLDQAEVLVAEVTTPSLGVGYEIGRAINMGKRILCLYRADARPGKKLSAMIRGLHNEDDVIVQDYKEEELDEIFREFFTIEDGLDDDEDEDGEGDEDDEEDDEDDDDEGGEDEDVDGEDGDDGEGEEKE